MTGLTGLTGYNITNYNNRNKIIQSINKHTQNPWEIASIYEQQSLLGKGMLMIFVGPHWW